MFKSIQSFDNQQIAIAIGNSVIGQNHRMCPSFRAQNYVFFSYEMEKLQKKSLSAKFLADSQIIIYAPLPSITKLRHVEKSVIILIAFVLPQIAAQQDST